MIIRGSSIVPFLIACCSNAGQGAENRARLELKVQVCSVLIERCWECHNALHSEGGLRLDSRAGLEAGGFSGQSLLRTPPEENELMRRISSDEPAYRMPNGHAPLTAGEQRILREWIVQGAPWPDEQIARMRDRQDFYSHTFWSRLERTLSGETAELPFVQGGSSGCWRSRC